MITLKKLKENNGITLIALVITIVILLILAGISISTLGGDNGLFKRAQDAKKNTIDAQNAENETLLGYEDKINEVVDGVVKFENVDTKVTNPAKAMPAGGVTVLESDADKGIAIKDSKNNEWVWVEVPKTIFTTAKSETEYNNIKTDLIAYAADYREGKTDQARYWTDEYYDGCGVTSEKYTEMYNKMLSSVYTNGGFWIGRYETGISGTNTLESTTGRTAHTDITNDSAEAVSQPDMMPYNWIYCSEAQTLASKMSTDTNKTSSLLFGIQWDLTCKFLEVKSNLDKPAIKTDSKNWGNFYDATFEITSTLARTNGSPWTVITGTKATSSSKLLTTGASTKNSILNIYDFAGNEWEWTLEHATSGTSNPCAFRGGSYGNSGADNPAAGRGNNSTSGSNDGFGFRPSLY